MTTLGVVRFPGPLFLAEPRFHHFGKNAPGQYGRLENCCSLMGKVSERNSYSSFSGCNSSPSWLELVSCRWAAETDSWLLFMMLLSALTGVALCTLGPQAIDRSYRATGRFLQCLEIWLGTFLQKIQIYILENF